MQRVTRTSTRYHMRYHTFFLNLASFVATCDSLPRVTVKFIKNYIPLAAF